VKRPRPGLRLGLRRRRRVGQPTRLRPGDAVSEALTTIVARPGRAVLTSVGTVLGVAWFVTALGLASTASGQVGTAFAGRLATQVTVRQRGTGPVPAAYPYPPDVERRLKALNGVVAAGVYWRVRPALLVTARGVAVRPAVVAASDGFLAAAGVRISQGRGFGSWALSRAAPVCLLGSALARTLGIQSLRGRPSIDIDNEPCVVIGIFGRAIRRPSLVRAVVLPAPAAARIWGPPDPRAGERPTVLIQTRPGAAPTVGGEAPYAISPARPHRFAAIVPVRPQRLRDQVAGTLTGLFRALGWVSLGIGALSIAAVTWLSVSERGAEYGLRRAVGARRRHVLAHVIAESAILGLIGGLAGASLGVALVILLATGRHWVPVIAPLTVLPAPLAGAAAGVLASLVPAVRAARIQPAVALGRPPSP
jgi:putative ABC transport system permease protein